MMKEYGKCKNCGKEFKKRNSESKFCSVFCVREYRKKTINGNCRVCGVQLDENNFYKKGRKLCISCGKKKEREWNVKRYWRNREKYLNQQKSYYQLNRKDILDKKRQKYEREIKKAIIIKMNVFNAYGGKCECCGENRMEFLTIDHIGGGGRKERKSTGSGKMLYRWLLKHGCPKERYRLLCMNCNFSIGMWGYCPHKNGSFNIQSA